MRQSFPFLSDSIDLKGLFSSNVYKFIAVLLGTASELLWKGKKSTDAHRKYIDNIISAYDQYIHVPEDRLSESLHKYPNVDTEEQQEIFEILRKYAKKKIDYNNLTHMLKQKFTYRFSSDITDGLSDLTFVSGFLVRLFFCHATIDQKKHLCVIDNIETFVRYDPDHPIVECELELIVKGCLDATRKSREILIPIQKEIDYQTFYGFLLVTRETTVSTALYDLDQSADYKKETEIDISSWFCTSDIYRNKRDFCNKKGISLENNHYVEAYCNILGDNSTYRWGLKGIASKMFKNSHRRNVECLPDALASIPEREIQYFNLQWDKARKYRQPSYSSLRTLCRKYILRVLFDHVHRKGYFDMLMVGTPELDMRGQSLQYFDDIIARKSQYLENNSFARKISTILHLVSFNHDSERYISFPRLIHSILKRPNLPYEPTREDIYDIGRTLFIMNETRNQRTNWTSLVCIKFTNRERYNIHNLCEIMQTQWKNYKNNPDMIDNTMEFGVRITKAGSFFAKILPDFEFFACRFLPHEPALLSLENIKPFYIKKERIFRAIAIIRVVQAKAFACVDEIIMKDKEFFSAPGSANGVPLDFTLMYQREYSWLYKESKGDDPCVHPHRILTQHSGYISNYIDYISRFVSENTFEKSDDKEKLLTLARNELSGYKEKITQLRNEFPSYFSKLQNN